MAQKVKGGGESEAVTRPMLRWHGGKWMLAPWIISHFPRHRVYVEPFGGAGSVLMRKPRAYAEVYNDLDGDAVNLFHVMRCSDQSARLVEVLRLTPFARTEFFASYEPSNDPVERARRLIVRCYMGHGSDGHNPRVRTGFRANSNRSGTTPAHDWANYPDAMAASIARLQGVIIENRPATQVMVQHDSADTLHYVDPPYMHETRFAKSRPDGSPYHGYVHEMTVEQHRELLACIHKLRGMVLLSGYASALYSESLSGWECIERAALADGARKRTEVLWLNPACSAKLHGSGGLFEHADRAMVAI